LRDKLISRNSSIIYDEFKTQWEALFKKYQKDSKCKITDAYWDIRDNNLKYSTYKNGVKLK